MEGTIVGVSVRQEGRLGDPESALRTESRVHPALLRALAASGLDEHPAPAPASPKDPVEDQLRHVGEAHEAFDGIQS